MSKPSAFSVKPGTNARLPLEQKIGPEGLMPWSRGEELLNYRGLAPATMAVVGWKAEPRDGRQGGEIG